MTLDDGDNARESPKFAYRWHRPTGRYAGTKLKASAARNSRSNVTLTDWFSTKASLETRKVYQVLPDPDGVSHRQLRVNDESGEDYLYLADYFSPIKLP